MNYVSPARLRAAIECDLERFPDTPWTRGRLVAVVESLPLPNGAWPIRSTWADLDYLQRANTGSRNEAGEVSAGVHIMTPDGEHEYILIRDQLWLVATEEYFHALGDAFDEALLAEAVTVERQQASASLRRRTLIDGVFADGEAVRTKRAAIPADIKMLVWRRDGGRCQTCGSQQLLEFDHVIPLAMGGSNTARNLQLLCEACNRSKGARLV